MSHTSRQTRVGSGLKKQTMYGDLTVAPFPAYLCLEPQRTAWLPRLCFCPHGAPGAGAKAGPLQGGIGVLPESIRA